MPLYDLEHALISKPNFYKTLELLTLAAILDPVEGIRKTAIYSLSHLTKNLVKRGYEIDGSVFLDMESEGHFASFYVCKMPDTYINQLSRAINFEIE
jgi:hypothetical protein